MNRTTMREVLESEKFLNYFRRKFNHSYTINSIEIDLNYVYFRCDEKVFQLQTDYVSDLIQEFKKEPK